VRVPPIVTEKSPLGEAFVCFRTVDGLIAGTARREEGERESHYRVSDIREVAASTPPSMVADPDEPGSFRVSGPISHRLDDGVVIVESMGFTFWLDPEELPGEGTVGDHLAFVVTELTLYL